MATSKKISWIFLGWNMVVPARNFEFAVPVHKKVLIDCYLVKINSQKLCVMFLVRIADLYYPTQKTSNNFLHIIVNKVMLHMVPQREGCVH